MKKVMYGVVGILLGFLFYTSLLIRTPSFVNFTNLSYGSETPIKTKTSTDNEYADKYEFESPYYFSGYNLTDEDVSKLKNNNIVNYGRKNPMEYFEHIVIPKVENVENENQLSDVGDDELESFEIGTVKGLDTKTGKMKSINIDDIKQLVLENGVLPVDESLYNITSRYGIRQDPFDKLEKFHKGLDIASEYINGREVMSILDGIVVYKSRNNGYGNFIVVNHGNFDTLYAHLEGFSKNVDIGTLVEAGDVLGYVGNTGRSTGPHLHIEFDVDWVKVDPELFMSLLTNSSSNGSKGIVDFNYFKEKYGK